MKAYLAGISQFPLVIFSLLHVEIHLDVPALAGYLSAPGKYLILMPLPPDTKSCLTCGNMLAGRIDKKFCDDYCRSMYNNKVYNSDRGASFIRKVNSILRKNRRILEEVLPTGEEGIKVPKARLTARGFNFNYLTSAYAHNKGAVYYFVYEYGYLLMEPDWYYVVRRSEVVR